MAVTLTVTPWAVSSNVYSVPSGAPWAGAWLGVGLGGAMEGAVLGVGLLADAEGLPLAVGAPPPDEQPAALTAKPATTNTHSRPRMIPTPHGGTLPHRHANAPATVESGQ
ncbi:hypothetical protein [Actinocrinis sp.]|uniref:hypothetical protein n=1 Tax=Actinocrinis sp. TaxID=1920516 RepID=UPI002D6E7252|nr:hypothetical protein [Actinocrinis sp.]HZP53874.1 hypothetical protein [Actinocrinis sp.]